MFFALFFPLLVPENKNKNLSHKFHLCVVAPAGLFRRPKVYFNWCQMILIAATVMWQEEQRWLQVCTCG